MWRRLRKLAGKTWVHVTSAVLVMGSWAALANHSHGLVAALRAAVAQAGASALVTFSLKTALEAMSARLRGSYAFVVPPTITCVVVLGLLVGVHLVAGTHELWSTISIPYAASSLYAWIYTGLMVKRRRA